MRGETEYIGFFMLTRFQRESNLDSSQAESGND